MAFWIFLAAVGWSVSPQDLALTSGHALHGQEIPVHYRCGNALPGGSVAAVALEGSGAPVVAVAGKLHVLGEEGHWLPFPGPGFAVERMTGHDGSMFAVGDRWWARHESGQWGAHKEASGPITALAASPRGLAFAVGSRVFLQGAPLGSLPASAKAATIASLALGGGPAHPWTAMAGTADGLFALPRNAEEFVPLYPADGMYSWAPIQVGALVWADGAFWFGARNGAGRHDGAGWRLYTGSEGLPVNTFTCAAGGGGRVWLGTRQGLVRRDAAGWAYRASRRWLSGDAVRAIAPAPDGAWVATPSGVTHLRFVPTTLEAKAAHYEAVIDARHRRDGLVVATVLEAPGDTSAFHMPDGDNDGGHTTKYGAAQAFRYAATGAADARERAKAVFRTLELLVEVTGIPGFPARTIVPVQGHPDPNERYGEAFNLRRQERDPLWKNILPRWPLSTCGRYYWKCDTSSDEMVSHFFFLDVYWRHVAETEAEKEAVRRLTRAMMDHIVDHGFRLVDHDGKPTRWADWSPETLNTLPHWPDRGLKSLQILSFLAAAGNITGDPKYEEAAAFLCEEHHYDTNAVRSRAAFPPTHVVPWDDNQAFSSLYTMMRHAKNPDRRMKYTAGLLRAWWFVEQQNDPFYNYVFLSQFPDDPPSVLEAGDIDFQGIQDRSLRALRGMPWSFIEWDMPNSHRLDVVPAPPASGHRPGYGWGHDGQALPIQERNRTYLNQSHFELDRGGNGTLERPATMFLLPYWMARAHGFITGPAKSHGS